MDKIIIFTLPTLLLSILLILQRSWSNATGLFVNQFFESKSFNFETESIFVIPLMSETVGSLISSPKSTHFIIKFLLSTTSSCLSYSASLFLPLLLLLSSLLLSSSFELLSASKHWLPIYLVSWWIITLAMRVL